MSHLTSSMIALCGLTWLLSSPLLSAQDIAQDASQELNSTTPLGPYKTAFTSYKHVASMDKSDQKIDIWYPSNGKDEETFPLISFAHGMFGGGMVHRIAYGRLLQAIAEFGYVVVAPEACSVGCSDGESLPDDPSGFKNFYQMQLNAITWAKNQSAAGEDPFTLINFDIGVGIAGHSMGGQATLFSSSAHAEEYDIRAAVMQHAFTHSYPAPSVPFLAFTGTKDDTAPPSMTHSFFEAEGANPIKVLANKAGASHHEPDVTDYNPMMAPYTAAWFKIFLDKTPQLGDFDFHDMIFGSGDGSLCHGGDGDMAECELHDATVVV